MISNLPRVAILISGTGSNMCSIIDTALEQSWPLDLALVLADRPEAGGLAEAAQRGVATEVVHYREFSGRRSDFDRSLVNILRALHIQWVVLAGFMRILGKESVDAFPKRILNIHPSLLPKYPGLHTHRRAIDGGDTVHGCTVHLVTEGLDSGPILGQAQVAVLPDDTEESLRARVLEQEHILYPAMVKKTICGGIEAR